MHIIPETWLGIIAVGIFLMTYAGVALGGIPGLALDRTGIALLGAIAMAAAGVLSMSTALQWITWQTGGF